MRSVGGKEKRGAKKELQRCKFLDRKISKRFLRPRNNKLSQVTVYLFLGPKKAAVLISKIYFKKPPKLPHALKLSSFSALVINGPWFKSCSVLKLKLEAGCLRDIFLICKVGCWKARERKIVFRNLTKRSRLSTGQAGCPRSDAKETSSLCRQRIRDPGLHQKGIRTINPGLLGWLWVRQKPV